MLYACEAINLDVPDSPCCRAGVFAPRGVTNLIANPKEAS
jgi:hypothetical protein